MPQKKLTPRALLKYLFYLVIELDDLLGTVPAFLLDRIFQKIFISETTEEMYRRRFYLQAAVSSQVYILAVYLLFQLPGANPMYLPFVVFAYFLSIYYFQFREGDKRLALAAEQSPKAQARFARDLKISKMLLSAWSVFILSIQFLLPH